MERATADIFWKSHRNRRNRPVVLQTSANQFMTEQDAATVQLLTNLKINSLARSSSEIRLKTIKALIARINTAHYSCIPLKRSVGISDDLDPWQT